MTPLIIIEQALLYLPLILGAYISIALMKTPDLSIESAYLFGAILGAKTIVALQAFPIIIQLLAALAASVVGGMAVGFTSSTLTQRGGIPHLLSSILTFGLFHGITQFVASSYISLSSFPNALALLPVLPHHPELIALLAIHGIALTMLAYILKTQLGYSFAIFGINPAFFSCYGINTRFVFTAGIVLSNALAGLAGFLCAQSNGFAELNMGAAKALLCITALILGKTLTKSTKLISLKMPVFGVFSYFTLQQMLLKVGFNLKYFTALQACIVLIILVSTFKKSNHKKQIDHLGI